MNSQLIISSIYFLNTLYHSLFFSKNDIRTHKKELEIVLSILNELPKVTIKISTICIDFFNQLNHIKKILKTDLNSFLKWDPAAVDKYEILLTYPGFYAIYTYRIAHLFYLYHVPYLPRILSEYAHQKTGIDIHPGARISHHFFIDHGTGIVIGETSYIGHHVKIYQGVTLGAATLDKGIHLKGEKRHPTIYNYVTIYARAAVLGGKTKVHSHSVIGIDAVVTTSVPAYTLVINDKSMKQIAVKRK